MPGPYHIPQHAHGSLLTRKNPMWQVARDGTDVTRDGWAGSSSPVGPGGEELSSAAAEHHACLPSPAAPTPNTRTHGAAGLTCGSAGPSYGIAHPSHSIARPDHGTAHPNHSIVCASHGTAHPNHSIARPNHGITRPRHGIAHPRHSVAHPCFGIAGLATAPHAQLKPLLRQISSGGREMETAPWGRGSEDGR